MSPRVAPLAFALLSALAFAPAAFAHPEIEDALARLNPLIAATPADASLYLARGELYAQHAEWLVAEANYLRAAELSPRLPRLALARGTLALATGRLSEARTHLDAALTLAPGEPESLVLRARVFTQFKAPAAALADYDAALRALPTPDPDLYLARAAVCASPARALRGLDEGLTRLGSVPALETRALDLEIYLGRVDAALARLDRLIAGSERREPWLKRRGDLLAAAGRPAEARAAYAAALAALAALPTWLANSPASARLYAELTRLTAALPSS